MLVRPHEPIKIEGGDRGKEFLDFPVGQMAAVETPSKTYIQIIKSSALISEVVHELQLDQNTPEKAGSGNLFARIYASAHAIYDDLEDYLNDLVAILKYGRLLKEDPFTKAVNNVAKGLTLKSYEDTYVFEIKYTDKDPRRVAAVANTTARLFIEFMEKMRSTEAKYQGERLETELEQSRQRLISARQDLESYKVSHRFPLPAGV